MFLSVSVSVREFFWVVLVSRFQKQGTKKQPPTVVGGGKPFFVGVLKGDQEETHCFFLWGVHHFGRAQVL